MYTQESFLKSFMEKELKQRGINILCDEYYQNKEFKKMEEEYVLGKIKISKSWWIEKNIVGQKRLKKIYGIYALGVEHEFSEKELRNSAWMGDLADKYNERKAGEGESGRTQKDVEQYFNRKECNRKDGKDEFGLIERLRRLGFDVDKFDGPKAKEERVKLLYFLFGFEFEYKVKITPFLSRPSFENIDNSIVGDRTRNGELMAYLKNNVMKEIDEDYIIALQNTLNYIADSWEDQIYYVSYVANIEKDMKLLDDIHADMQWIVDLVEKGHETSDVYSDSLLESFYLKLSLHEMLGREKELEDISKAVFKDGVEIDEFTRKRLEEYMSQTIKICWTGDGRYEEVSRYIEDHRNALAQCVFGREKITGNDYKKFDKAADCIPQLLDFYRNNTKACFIDSVPVILVISHMQTYIFENEKIDSDFYRHQSSDKVTYRTELDNGEEALRRSQYAWLEKVKRRLFDYLGRKDVNIKVREIERCLDTLLMDIYGSNSLVELRDRAWLLLSYVETFVGRRLIVEKRYNALIDFLNDRSFELWCCDRRMIYVFLNQLDEVCFCGFMNEIKYLIADVESNTYICSYDIEQDDLYSEDNLEAFLEMDVSFGDRKIDVVNGGIRVKNLLL